MEMSLFQGLLNNILITIGSCLLPMIVGIAAYFICSRNESLIKLAHLCGVFFESFLPCNYNFVDVLLHFCSNSFEWNLGVYYWLHD